MLANSRRAQESLRVLEEFSRLSGGPLAGQAGRFEKARFEIYDLEQHLVGRVRRHDKAGRLNGLYLVLDAAALGGRDEVEVAAAAVRGGARIIQLRDKHRGKADVLAAARKLRSLCAEKGVLFVVNDHLDIALAVRADGLHLGQDDLPPAEARRILPLDMLIGCSTHSTAEAVRAQAAGADYVALGSIYPTTSKERYRLVGLETLRRTRSRVSVPLVAIGGINDTNVREVIKAGADAVAVISAVLGADDVERAARKLAARTKKNLVLECEIWREPPLTWKRRRRGFEPVSRRRMPPGRRLCGWAARSFGTAPIPSGPSIAASLTLPVSRWPRRGSWWRKPGRPWRTTWR